MISDAEIRLKCVEICRKCPLWNNYDVVSLLMQSELIFRFVKRGLIPYGQPNIDADKFLDTLIENTLKEIKDSGSIQNNNNNDTGTSNIAPHLISGFLSMFRRPKRKS